MTTKFNKSLVWIVLALIVASNAMALTSTAPVSITGTVTVDGSGVTQPVSGTFYQATQPVSIATMPSTPVTGTFYQATQPVSGTFFQATQPVSIAAAVTANETSNSRSDTYTTTANGTTVNVLATPARTFAIAVKATGAVTSWTVVLEGSLDNVNFTTVMSHTNTTPGDGLIYWSGTSLMPVLYFRSRCSAITLGGGTNVVATIVGM